MLSGQAHHLFQSLLVIGPYTSVIHFTQVCSCVASLTPSDQVMRKSDTWKRELTKNDQQRNKSDDAGSDIWI